MQGRFDPSAFLNDSEDGEADRPGFRTYSDETMERLAAADAGVTPTGRQPRSHVAPDRADDSDDDRSSSSERAGDPNADWGHVLGRLADKRSGSGSIEVDPARRFGLAAVPPARSHKARMRSNPSSDRRVRKKAALEFVHVVALYYRSSTLHQIHSGIRCIFSDAAMRPHPRPHARRWWPPTPSSRRSPR